MTAGYDPLTVTVWAGTAYEQAHEWAHVAQEYRRSPAWLVFRALGRTRAGHFAILLLETEAAAVALWTLQRCRIWEPGDWLEALAGLHSYAAALIMPEIRALHPGKASQRPTATE